MSDPNEKIVLLAGGVGGAKLAQGLQQLVPPNQLTIVVNTGDDFQHLGLTICTDLDTVMYTLAGVNNAETGWGRADESWRAMHSVHAYGGPGWFNLGDLDLGTHLVRTHLLNEGASLTAVTRQLCQKLGIEHPILPMSDKPAPTRIKTADGVLGFQEWFVRERWQPAVEDVLLSPDNVATHAVALALQKADYVIIAPSNPFVSIDPILNCYPVRASVMDLPRAVVAVSPIVGGDAVKGPAAKLMRERGMAVSAAAVADFYGDLLDGFVYDSVDKGQMDNHPLATICIDTMMPDAHSRERVAQATLDFARSLA